MNVPPGDVVAVSLILAGIGAVGLLVRRDAVTVILCVEIILNAGNLAFVGFARLAGSEIGHTAVLAVMAVAAAEAAVGLALVIRLSRRRGDIRLDSLRDLKG